MKIKNIFRGALLLPFFIQLSQANLHNPESSVVINNKVYVSNIGDMNRLNPDGDGFISVLSLDGKTLNEKLIKNLNDPKGTAEYKGDLVFTDLDKVHIVDVNSTKIIKTIKTSATFLNDIFIENDIAYVTDTFDRNVLKVNLLTGKSKKILNGIGESPNGIWKKGENLYIASWAYKMSQKGKWNKTGALFRFNLINKEITYLSPKDIGTLDGILPWEDKGWLVSDKRGNRLLLINETTHKFTVFSTDYSDPADLSYFNGHLMIPSMKKNKLHLVRIKRAP